jgi:Zn-dependent peptidase ImmA (M78 family)
MLPFAQGEQAEQTAPTYICRSSIQNRAEIQANLFASSLLMPKAMVVAIWGDCYGDGAMDMEALRRYGHAALGDDPWIQGRRFPSNEDEYNACLIKAVIRPVAARFRVSLQAMQIRLGELGLLPKVFPLAIN